MPEGIAILNGERLDEEETIKRLTKCCEQNDTKEHPCPMKQICRALHNRRAGSDGRVGGWKWSLKTVFPDGSAHHVSDEKRYADSLPVLRSPYIKEDRVLRIG